MARRRRVTRRAAKCSSMSYSSTICSRSVSSSQRPAPALLTRAIAGDRPIHPAECAILIGWAERARTARRRTRSQRCRPHSGGQSSSVQPNVACGISASGCSRPGTPALRPAGSWTRSPIATGCLVLTTRKRWSVRWQAAWCRPGSPVTSSVMRAWTSATRWPPAAPRLPSGSCACSRSQARIPPSGDHARILADAAGRAAPALGGELGQAIPGKCWAATDPFRESTVLLCEFSYPAGGNRHAVLARLDPVWHDAVSSLAALFLEEEGSLDAGSAVGLARRLGADLREVPGAEAAGLLQAGLDAFAQHGPAPWAERDS